MADLTTTAALRRQLMDDVLKSMNNPTNSISKGSEVNALIDKASNTATAVTSQVKTNVELARTQTQDRAALLEQMKEQAELTAKAQLVSSSVQTKTEVATAQRNTSAANTYSQNQGSPEAVSNRSKLNQDYLDAQNEYNAGVADAEKSGGVVGFFKSAFPVAMAKTRLEQAQKNLFASQRAGGAATTNLLNTFAQNQAIEGARSGAEQASSDEKVRAVNIMVEKLNTQQGLSKDQIAGYAAQIGIEQSLMQQAVGELKIAKGKKELSQGFINDTLAKFSVLDAIDKIDKEEILAGKRTAHVANMEGQVKEWLIARGRESEVGKFTYEASIEPMRNEALSNPDVADFLSYRQYATNNTHSYITAMQNKKQGIQLTPSESMVVSYGDTQVRAKNSAIQKEIDQLSLAADKAIGNPVEEARIKNTMAQLQGSMLDPNNAEDGVAIVELLRASDAAVNADATDAISSGAIQIPSMKEALEDPNFRQFQNSVPSDMKELFMSDEFKNIDLAIKQGDAGGSVNATFEQILGVIQKSNHASLEAFGNANDLTSQKARVAQISKGLAGYYAATRKVASQAYDLKGMDGLRISGVDSNTPTTWASGLNDTKKINMENAGEIQTILMNGLRKLRVDSSKRFQSF